MLEFHNCTIEFVNGGGLQIEALAIKPHTTTLLSGTNGCGKSTLLRHIAGLNRFRRGKILNNSAPITHRDLLAMCTYLPQRAYMFDRSVRANLSYAIRGIPRAEQQQRIQYISDKFHLTDVLDRSARSLSGGQKQRVAIARAYLSECTYYLFDEPFTGLDKHSRNTLGAMFIELKDANKGLVITSHESIDDFILPDHHTHIENDRVINRY